MSGIIDAHDVSAVVYSGNSTPEFYVPAEAAGIMHRPRYRTGVSSSDIIQRIVQRYDAETL